MQKTKLRDTKADNKEKLLLLADLCARLPYNVKCLDNMHGDSVITSIDIEDNTVYCFDFDEWVNISNIKPYLRPMSSMTKDEELEFTLLDWRIDELDDNYPWTPYSGDIDTLLNGLQWLNKKMFDYRGLIPMGLALEAPEEMYKEK